MSAPKIDLLIRNVRVVRPHGNVVHEADIAVKDGRVVKVAPGQDANGAKTVGNPGQKGRVLLFPVLFFFRFYLLPVPENISARGGVGIGKHVGVPPNELFHQAADNVLY